MLVLIIYILLVAFYIFAGYYSFEKGHKHSALFYFFAAGFIFNAAIDIIQKMIK